MSVSAVTSSSNLTRTSTQSTTAQFGKLFKQLASALKSGDLSDAQKAYSSLQNLMQNSSSANTQSSSFQKDFAALGQALSSGSLSQAQSDFSNVQSDLRSTVQSGSTQAAHRGQHRHAASETSGSDGDSDDSTSSSSSNTSTSTASSEIYGVPNVSGTRVNIYA